jgi:hypothetical protein
LGDLARQEFLGSLGKYSNIYRRMLTSLLGLVFTRVQFTSGFRFEEFPLMAGSALAPTGIVHACFEHELEIGRVETDFLFELAFSGVFRSWITVNVTGRYGKSFGAFDPFDHDLHTLLL